MTARNEFSDSPFLNKVVVVKKKGTEQNVADFLNSRKYLKKNLIFFLKFA